MILVVMAAGMGSRFGGSKQTTGVGPNGEFIIDYSVYDAIRAGFSKVVFIIRKENYEEFRNTIGKRIEGNINVQYVFQEMSNIPDGVTMPDGRVKPWGTGHALLSCKDVVDENFIIINADDFYGRDSFQKIGDYLKTVDKTSKNYSMVAYKVSNTMSQNGSVSRGICDVVDGKLANITERTNILYHGDDIVYIENDEATKISKDTLVSLNLWGFTPMIFDDAYRYFTEFFNEQGDFLKKEFYLPTIVDKSIKEGIGSVEVLSTTSRFCGMTYKEDKEELENYIKSLIDNGDYPENLWK